MSWKSRIVGHGRVAPDQLVANPYNHRKHPQGQRDALAAAIRDVGFIRSVTVNQRTGNLIDGHERVWQALQGEEPEIDVEYVDLSEDEEKKTLAFLDKIGEMAEVDPEALDRLLREINTGEEVLQELLAGMADEAGLYLGDEPAEAPEAEIDRAEELNRKWGVKRGDVWQIGEHRLMCGDSTSAEDVGELMDGEKAEMMFTDPPYGVNYEGGHFHSGNVNIKRKRESLASDDSADIYGRFLPVALRFVDGPCYLWFADSKALPVYQAVEDCGGIVSALLIWHKTNATYAAMNAQYKQRHEPCLYFKPRGSTLRWCGPSDACTLWEFKRDAQNDMHPTQKPVDLALNALKNHKAETVVDFFCGSGSTMVAAQQLGRRAFGMEISPAYCAVILERMSQMGIEGTKLEKVKHG
jgi:hypothetical protein